MRRLFREEGGLSTVEYIVILILVAVLGIVVWSVFGDAIINQITGATSEVDSLSGSGGGEGAGAKGTGTGSGSSSDSASANSGTAGGMNSEKAKSSANGGGSGGNMSNPEGTSGVSRGGSGVDKSGRSSNSVVTFSQDGQVTEDKSSFPLAWIVGGAFLVLALFLGIRMGKSKKTGGA